MLAGGGDASRRHQGAGLCAVDARVRAAARHPGGRPQDAGAGERPDGDVHPRHPQLYEPAGWSTSPGRFPTLPLTAGVRRANNSGFRSWRFNQNEPNMIM